GELDRDATLPRLDEHDPDDHGDTDQEDREELEPAALAVDRRALGGETRDDRREDQDRHAVADAPLGDELTQPHAKSGAGGPRQDDERRTRSVEAGDEVTAMETGEPEEPAAALVQREHEAGRLHDRQGDGEVTGPLRDLLLTDLAFVLPLLQLRDYD